MDLKLREDYRVDFDWIDGSGKMSMQGLSTCMQIIAAHHASQLGFNYYKNGENPGLFWIVSRVRYVMKSYPSWDDQISVQTYPGGYDKLYAVRLFDILDARGEQIGYIVGDYLLMDMNRGRPVPIKGIQGELSCLDFPYEGEKLPKLAQPVEVIKEEKRQAYYSEMDLNGHMNNSQYVKWAIDLLPLECLATHEVRSLEINYNASIQCGMEIQLILGKDVEGNYIASGNYIETGKNYFIAKMVLEPREIAIEG